MARLGGAEAAWQSVRIAGAPVLPWIGAEAGAQGTRDLDSDRSLEDAGEVVAVSWQLDLWGTLRSGQAAAASEASAVANDAVYARQSIAATVGRSWMGYIEIGQLIAATNHVVNQYSQLVALAKERQAAGVWAVDERTAKREVRRLTEAWFLILTRRGVRGRVAAYRLGVTEIAARSTDFWGSVGPDFAERMTALVPEPTKVVRLQLERPGEEAGQGGDWRAVRRRLRAENPALFANWFDRLDNEGRDGGRVILRAPFVGRYVETHLARILEAAVEGELGPCGDLRIRCSA